MGGKTLKEIDMLAREIGEIVRQHGHNEFGAEGLKGHLCGLNVIYSKGGKTIKAGDIHLDIDHEPAQPLPTMRAPKTHRSVQFKYGGQDNLRTWHRRLTQYSSQFTPASQIVLAA